jgi:hypothetical protein
MNRKSHLIGICLSAMILAIAFGPSLSVAARAIAEATVAQNELQTLRSAYMILVMADHDYKGHRVHAMHEIEKACDILGTDIRGDGKGHENQGASDEQLRQAQQMLDQALSMAQSQGNEKIVKHINNAIKQLNLALAVK